MKRIETLNGLRAISIFLIFLYHVGLISFGGKFVGVFIILSGFFSIYTYRLQENEISVSLCLKYGIKKIIKFYPLHLLCILLTLPLFINILKSYSILKGFSICLANIFLMQSLVPKQDFYFSFNAPEWTLSTLFVLYLFTPILYKLIQFICKNVYRVVGSISILYIIQIVYAYFYSSAWAISISPLYRSIDYIYGGIFAYLLMNKIRDNEEKNYLLATINEFCCIGLVVFSIIQLIPMVPWSYVVCAVFSPIFLICIIIFAKQKGIISKVMLSNKAILYLGSISFEFYMLHQIVYNYIINFTNIGEKKILTALVAFLITFILSGILNSILTKPTYNKFKNFKIVN